MLSFQKEPIDPECWEVDPQLSLLWEGPAIRHGLDKLRVLRDSFLMCMEY